MVPFPYLSMSPSNPVSRSTPNHCTAVAEISHPFPHLPSATPPPQSPRSRLPYHRMFGSPRSPAPIASFSGVPSPTFPNSPNRSQQAHFQSWTSSRRHALHPVLVTVCVPQTERALVRLVSLVPRVNRARRVSSALNASLVHRTAPSVTRESLVLVSALPPP